MIMFSNNIMSHTSFYFIIRVLSIDEITGFEVNIFNNNTVRDYSNRFITDNQDELIAQLHNIMLDSYSHKLLFQPVNMYLFRRYIKLHSLFLVN